MINMIRLKKHGNFYLFPMPRLRIATFNLENLDDRPGEKPTLAERINVMRPQLMRLDADILCLQEVNGQEVPGQTRQLLALQQLLADTPYQDFYQVSTTTADLKQVFNERNLVTLSRFEILESKQYKHQFAPAPFYRAVTATPLEVAKEISWERPILHVRVKVTEEHVLDVINVHLKSKLPTPVAGQKINNFTWKSASGWAEGFFISSMKRVGQALETRILIDQLFDANESAWITVCGDFNAEADEVPMEAIRGDLENTANAQLIQRVMVLCENTIPKPARYSLFHRGHGKMLDHVLVSRSLLTYYQGAEIHNELLHDESLAFATDQLFPESDHAPVVAKFNIPDFNTLPASASQQ
jgi:endonuclease/exonuclease/phosphatase family metal-dependent hydrolase